MAKYKRLPENYFKFVNPVIVSLIGVAMYLLIMAWLDPKNISATYFGRVAEFVTWVGTENGPLMKQLVLLAMAVHISETMVAVYLCHKRRIGNWATLAWTIQTLLLGFFSLYHLIWPGPKPPKPAKKQEKPSKSPKKAKDSKPSNAKKEVKQPNATPKKAKAKKEK